MSGSPFPRPPVVLLLLAACAAEQPFPAPVGQLRQAFPATPTAPVATGLAAQAHLGASVAGCPAVGFVAGAPGDNATLHFAGTSLWFPNPLPGTWDAGALGASVACDGTGAALRVLSAGATGAWFWNTSGTTYVFHLGSATTLAIRPAGDSPVVVGAADTSRVSVHVRSGASYLEAASETESADFGAGVAWDPGGAFFVAGEPSTGAVRVYAWGLDAGAVKVGQLDGPGNAGFGEVLAVGDVHPAPGRELIVGTPASGQVVIYGGAMDQLRRVMVLQGTPGSFGAALAVEPLPSVDTLRALWVGDPENDRVVRFLGDAGQALASGTVGARFGAAVAIAGGELVVGAPEYGLPQASNGAVYSLPLNHALLGNAFSTLCQSGASCVSSSCEPGVCVGGVLCKTSGRPGCALSLCSNGVCAAPVDAGPPDAGAEPGPPDAGLPDGGAPDAGADAGVPRRNDTPLQFQATGCGAVGAIPLAALGLLLFGRRRSARKTHPDRHAAPRRPG